MSVVLLGLSLLVLLAIRVGGAPWSLSAAGASGCARSRSATWRCCCSLPVGVIFYRTFEHGIGAVWDSITTPAAIHAFSLTLEVTLIAVPLNTVFGILAALALARGEFRGKALLRRADRPAVRRSRRW